MEQKYQGDVSLIKIENITGIVFKKLPKEGKTSQTNQQKDLFPEQTQECGVDCGRKRLRCF